MTSAAADLRGRFAPVLVMLAIMWGEEVLDYILPGSFDQLGIQPRRVRGLLGIPLAPFLHGGFQHLIANTLPFLILALLVAVQGRQQFMVATTLITVIGGLGVWLIAPPATVTIGASGLIFGYLTFLMARGFYSRRISDFLVGLGVLLIYGPLLWGALPFRVPDGVSWQAHLAGAAAGIVAASVTNKRFDRTALTP